MKPFAFIKMHGIGNDFILVDRIADQSNLGEWADLSRKICDRRFGIGADGLILLESGVNTEFRMRMFNPDGSEAEMCGNGIRCMARLAAEHGYLKSPSAFVETGAGVLEIEVQADQLVRVDMGEAQLTRLEIGMVSGDPDPFIEAELGFDGLTGTAVSMGNPHLVIFVPDVQGIQLESVGPKLEVHPLFPKRVNVHFVQVLSRTHLVQRTWERGAGITLACGTGACAVAVAAFETGRAERSVKVDLPGGQLHIEYLETGQVFMTGPATKVFEGTYPG